MSPSPSSCGKPDDFGESIYVWDALDRWVPGFTIHMQKV
jgi:hypothetical protein